MTPVMRHAFVLWHYLTANPSRHRDGLLVVCGSYDLRVCDYACDLFRREEFDCILITGGSGNWTSHLWDDAEANIFADRAKVNGIRDEAMILEAEATNFAENIRNARLLVPGAEKVTFVTKLNSIRRVIATAPIQWPGIDLRVDGPWIAFPGDVSNVVGIFGLIAEMVGDIDRLIKYPEAGFQVASDVPYEVHASYKYLSENGFGSHMLRSDF